MSSAPRRLAPKTLVFLVITSLMVILDQVTKFWVFKNVVYLRERIEVIPGFLSIVHSQNPGAAIGFLGDQPVAIRMTVFGIFTVIAVAVLISMLIQLKPEDRFQAGVVGLIMGGAIGNAIDRVHKQSVTDFILVYTDWAPLKDLLVRYVGTNEYPTFNVADSALVVGVGIFFLRYLFMDDSKEADQDIEDEETEVR